MVSAHSVVTLVIGKCEIRDVDSVVLQVDQVSVADSFTERFRMRTSSIDVVKGLGVTRGLPVGLRNVAITPVAIRLPMSSGSLVPT